VPYSNFKFLFFAVLGLVVGGKGKEKIESSKNRKRMLQLRIDFPYFVENLALCITAGLSPAMAINAILENDLSNSEQRTILIELKKLLLEINEGKSVTLALDGLAKRINLPEIYRFVDVLIVTMERGTPLAEILRQQAFDLREVQRRAFLDLGSKAEVKMMVPVVFLILPVSILFALWPSLYQLNQMSSF
jgi:tight adherence protein C